MANSDKNIVITPNNNQSGVPNIVFTGAGNSSITLRVPDGSIGSLTFESGTNTRLFSLDSSFSGTIFSVTDSYGNPAIETSDDGKLNLNETTVINGKGLQLPVCTPSSYPINDEGLLIYDTKNSNLIFNNGTSWVGTKKDEVVTDGLQVYLNAGITNSFGTGTSSTFASQGGGIQNIWYDLSGNNRHFTGNAAYLSSHRGLISGSAYSLLFSNVLDIDYHSIFFAIRFNGSATYPNGYSNTWDKIFGYNPSGSDRSPGIWRYPSERRIHWRYGPANSGTDFGKDGMYPSSEFDLNTWYYIGVTKNGGSTVVYVNGVQIGTGSVSNPKDSGSSWTYLFEGYTANLAQMDCVMIYNRVLTADEVFRNYNAIKWRIGI